MKKLAIAILGLTVVSSAVMAQTNQVLSRNAVGYVRVDAPSNKLNMVRVDFVNLAGSPYTVTNLIGTQLAQGSAVYAWDLSNQTYRTANRLARGWDTSGATNQIRRGEGMFIYSASNTSVYLMGEVPDAITAPTTRVINLNGLNMTGVPYPVDTPFTNTPWFLGAQSGDVVYFWDIGIQNYVTYNRLSRNWDNLAITNKILKPGEGFWAFRTTAGSTNLNFVKPYTWP